MIPMEVYKMVEASIMFNEEIHSVVYFLPISIPLRKLMQRFSKRVRLPMKNLHFYYKGLLLGVNDTAEKYGMQDYDKINVFYAEEQEDLSMLTIHRELNRANDRIHLILVNRHGFQPSRYHFSVKKKVNFTKLARSLSLHTGYPKNIFRFFYNGLRIREQDTPERLGMGDCDFVLFTVPYYVTDRMQQFS